jgi:hypothetical protein
MPNPYPPGTFPYAFAYYKIVSGSLNYSYSGALGDCSATTAAGQIDLPSQPDLKESPVLTIFDKAPREYSLQIGMPLTATVPGELSGCKIPPEHPEIDFLVAGGTPMIVYAPLPGGPVSDNWAFSGQGSGQQVPGTPDQTWQWNASPISP